MTQNAEYVFEFDHCEDLRQAVYEAVGAASVCWESMEGTGVFDTTRASAVADALLQYVNERYQRVNHEALQAMRREDERLGLRYAHNDGSACE